MFPRFFETPHKRSRRLAETLNLAIMEKSGSRIAQENYVAGVADIMAHGGLPAFLSLYTNEFSSKRTIGDSCRCYALAETVATLDGEDPAPTFGQARLKLKLFEQAYEDSGRSADAAALYGKALFALGAMQRNAGWSHAILNGAQESAQYAALGREVFNQAADGAADSPLWHRTRFQVGITEGCSPDELESRFEGARAFDPGTHEIYVDRAFQLLPKWYGSFDAIDAFARKHCDARQDEFGGTLYARIYSEIAREEYLHDTRADWGRLKGSMEAWCEATQSQRLLNTYAAMADLFEDSATVDNLFDARITAYFPDAWFSTEQAAAVLGRRTGGSRKMQSA